MPKRAGPSAEKGQNRWFQQKEKSGGIRNSPAEFHDETSFERFFLSQPSIVPLQPSYLHPHRISLHRSCFPPSPQLPRVLSVRLSFFIVLQSHPTRSITSHARDIPRRAAVDRRSRAAGGRRSSRETLDRLGPVARAIALPHVRSRSVRHSCLFSPISPFIYVVIESIRVAASRIIRIGGSLPSLWY